jgi:S-adenosylmethionine:tRNA ribosyltransferase-isomerase
MKVSEFDYVLPPERIAQEPLPRRDASKLLVLDRATGAVSHQVFGELPSLLGEGDLVILNDTRVVPARLLGVREATGGRVEAFLLRDLGDGRWLAFTKSGGKLREGEWLKLADGRARACVVERRGEEGDVLKIESTRPLAEVLDEAGYMPVPPYIHRDRAAPPSAIDRERYQTTYAREDGAVAAPTAGLHFTEDVFSDLEARGVARAFVTLHVGVGTFRPVKVEDVEAHTMDQEHYTVPAETATAIRECRARGGRVVAVGTTSVRTLESAASDERLVTEGPGVATLFMTPGYEFRVVDALVTNFHLPRGTPLMLTCAFAGRENVFAAYASALEEGYRFLSYGDAMLVL